MPVTLRDLFPFGDVDSDLVRAVGVTIPGLPISAAFPAIELGRAAVSLLERMTEPLEEVGLSPARWRLLMAAAFQAPPEGATVGDLARHLEVREPTVSATIDRLVGEGLVTKVKDPEDRRVVRVVVTGKGTELIARVAPIIGRTVLPIVEALGGPRATGELARAISAAVGGETRQRRSST